jgi:ankyrin repeat protein
MAAKWTLYWSFRNRDLDTSSELIHSFDKACYGVEVKEVAGRYGDTLLHIACRNGWLDMVKLLVEESGCDPEVKDCGKQRPLHYACRYGCLETIQYLIQEQKCDLTALTPDQWTPFYYACRYGHLNVIKYLVQIPGATSHIDQQAVLQLTCKYGYLDTLLYLVNEQGFIPEKILHLLRIACEHGFDEIVCYVYRSLDNFENMDLKEYKALLIFCCSNGRLDILKQLNLESRYSVAQMIIDKNMSGLHYACQEGHADVVKYLVEECGCDVNVCTRDGLTPLHLACKHGHSIEVVKFLLNRPECNSLVRANDGNTAIHFACTTNQFNQGVVEILVKAGAAVSKGTLALISNITSSRSSNSCVKPGILSSLLEVTACDPNTRNYSGLSPIHLATYPFIAKETIALHAETEFYRWIEYTDEQRAIIEIQEYVNRNHLKLNQLTVSNGDTILHIACVANKVNIVKHLLQFHNFDLNIKNNSGETPLCCALKYSAYQNVTTSTLEMDLSNLVCMFVTKSQWEPSLDDDGNTLFHLACQANQPHLIELLTKLSSIKVKFDHSLKNIDGYTPIELLTSPDAIVNSLMKYDVLNYIFKPGSVQHFIWFCKNIAERRLEALLTNPQYIKWEHRIGSACCTKYFILHLPDHPAFYVLLEICLHREAMKNLSETEFDISDEYNVVTHCYITEVVDFLMDSSLESNMCHEELLHAACKQSKHHFVNHLLSIAKCDPNYCHNCVTLSHVTTNPDIMQLLFQHGANVQLDDVEKLISISTKVSHFSSTFKSLKENGKWYPDLKFNFKGDTALHLSVRYQNTVVTEHLLMEYGCDPNAKNLENETPLHLATNSDIMQVLVQNGANILSEDIGKLFSLATKEQPISIDTLKIVVHFLLTKVECDPNIKNVDGESLLQLLMPIWTSQSEIINVIEVLMTIKQWDPNSCCTPKGETALHLSARCHKPEVVHFLLTEVECDPNIKNVDGETLLQILMSTWTSPSEIINVIKDLMTTKQWDPNSCCNPKGETALHLSARYQRSAVINFLLSEAKCDPYVKTKVGNTSIHLILLSKSDNECVAIFRVLVATEQWNPNLECNSNGDTPLHLAIRYNYQRRKTVRFLIFKAKCDPYIKNKRGITPIYQVVAILSDYECLEMVKDIVITEQWDPNAQCNSKGDTVLHVSVRYYRPRVTHFLLSKTKCNPNARNKRGETLIELLMAATSMWSASECIEIIKELLATKHWDPDSSCNSEGDTALHLTVRYRRLQVIQYLLHEVKCDPNIRNEVGETLIEQLVTDKYQWTDSKCIDVMETLTTTCWDPNSSCNCIDDTALHLTMRNYRPEIAHFLLSEAKCNPNKRNKRGETLIELLAATSIWSDSECIEIIKELFATKHWDPDSSCNSEGDTALHLTVRYRRLQVIQYLLHEVKCDPNIRNEVGETLIEQLVTDKYQWTDPECIDVIETLTTCWDPNSSCNCIDDTALHLTMRNYQPEIAHFLLSEAKCNPNIRNKRGETMIELLLAATSMWSDSECIEIIKELFATKHWDPDSSCNSEGDTALHLTVRYRRLQVIQYLLHEVKCDPNIRNEVGETLIEQLVTDKYQWTDSECIDVTCWDPNSSYNCIDDTVLHLTMRNYQPEIAHFLLSEAKCNPNIRNKRGETMIELLLAATSMWSDSECIEIIKELLATKQWDPDSNCSSKSDTALHLTVRNCRLQVTQYLLHNVKYIRLIEQLMTDKNQWSDSECIDVMKILLTTTYWNPNSSCNFRCDTALHLTVTCHRPEVTQFLLSEAKCSPNRVNEGGKTPIELLLSATSMWSDSECIEIIKELLATKYWNPDLIDFEGDTALHLTVRYHRPEITQFLLSEAKCNPNIRNISGETLIGLLVPDINWPWLDSECIEVIKVLMETRQWDANSSCNFKGDTALHLLVKHNKHRVVRFLLSEAKCDPNSKNFYDETPLQLANNAEIINDLIRYGSNPNNVYKLYGKSINLKRPLMPSVKVFIVGNSGVGKSTLTEALKIEVPFLARAFLNLTRRRVSDVDLKTAGIVPHEFTSKNYGRVTLYDFAGHREFYSSHAAFLHNVIQGTSSLFLIVVNISANNDIIQQNILYWLSFVENQCSVVNCTSHVFVIGSHADIAVSRGEDPQQIANETSTSIKKIFQSLIVNYIGIYPMDCQYPDSPGMSRLRYQLIEICNAIRIPEMIPFNAHCFQVFLLDRFRVFVAVIVQDIQDKIVDEQSRKEGIARFLPNTSSSICKVCDELNKRGHILFLKNSNNINNSWVIIDKARLLSEVTGTIFAPKDFEQHCQLAVSTGVVPLSRLTEHFPDIETEVVTGFMTRLEFCHEIFDCQLLELITKHHESLNIGNASTLESERYFLFPGLVTQQAPENVWEQNHDFKYHCGWILQCANPNQFFSSQFLQVLLLRLAFSFALVKMEVHETIPAFQRECSIWKNGIFWGENFGMEVIVEVHSSNKTVILQIRCREEHLLRCIAQRSLIIRKILQCTQDFCPQIKPVESFIHPSGATKFPIKLTSEMPRFNVQKVAEAIVKDGDHCPLSVVSATRTILLDHLVTFEPYAEIGLSILKNLLSHPMKKLSDNNLEILSLKSSGKVNICSKIFKESKTLSSPPDELLTVLREWRDGCEGTYKCLKERLDQYSIFAGRNLLVSVPRNIMP